MMAVFICPIFECLAVPFYGQVEGVSGLSDGLDNLGVAHLEDLLTLDADEEVVNLEPGVGRGRAHHDLFHLQ